MTCVMLGLPEIVARLPKSSMSVRIMTYLNNPGIVDTNTEVSSAVKDHPVVAGSMSHIQS